MLEAFLVIYIHENDIIFMQKKSLFKEKKVGIACN